MSRTQKTKNKKCPCHDEKKCGLHHYLLADEGCECTCPKPDPYGDTPVVCTSCGAVFVAEAVLRTEASKKQFKKTCESGGTFEGECCRVCPSTITGTWRLIRGPLRVPLWVPRVPEPKSKGAKG